MCGIAGIRGTHSSITLDQLISRMSHRGPDGVGTLHEGAFSLGMVRLAIVDLAGGDQPKTSDDKSVIVFFNGEIYNYRELQILLQEKGVRLDSDSDTEVILRLYEQEGLSCLERFRGMFAICIWDKRIDRLFLIRDRFGKKNIYYDFDPKTNAFSFASECTTLRPQIAKEDIDPIALEWFLSQRTVPGSRSVDRTISSLPPGCVLTLALEGAPDIKPYYHLPTFGSCPVEEREEERLLDELDELLNDSVRLRMRADVEVGSFLSGGLDSSLVVALASKTQGAAIKTYCLTYENEVNHKQSDREFSKEVAKRFGSDHHEVLLSPGYFWEELPKIVRRYGQPNSAVMANWFISQKMGRELKVALSGDGADELFGSYRFHRLASKLDKTSKNAERDADDEFLEKYQLKSVPQLFEHLSVFSDAELQRLLHPARFPVGGFARLRAERFSQLRSMDNLSQALEFDFSNLLVDQILNYADVLGMAHGLEIRAPYLDHLFAEKVMQLPSSWKIRNGETKYLLKRLALRYLPSELVFRPKEGFVEPIVYWIGNELREECRSVFEDESFNRLGFFQRTEVLDLVSSFQKEFSFSGAKKVWTLMCFALWEKYCVSGKL